jgi:ribosomal protein L35
MWERHILPRKAFQQSRTLRGKADFAKAAFGCDV